MSRARELGIECEIAVVGSAIHFLDDLELSAILRAVEKSTHFELVNDQVLSVHNTQRAYVTVLNQRAYIQDFDVEVAQFQAVADPQVNVLHEGVVLDVRPTIHSDRKYLTLEIQPTVANLVALRNFSSTLGGNTSPVMTAPNQLWVAGISGTRIFVPAISASPQGPANFSANVFPLILVGKLTDFMEDTTAGGSINLARKVVDKIPSPSGTMPRYVMGGTVDISFVPSLPNISYAVSRDAEAVTRIGISCRICPRDKCDQRAFPPSDRAIVVDPHTRDLVPYGITDL